jgi:hypothetical protein
MKIGEVTEDINLVGTRDAFHVPAILAWSEDDVTPGASVRFVDAQLTKVERCHPNDKEGIVDPFTSRYGLYSGTVFWVLLVPGCADNLRHVFNVKRIEPKHKPRPKDDYEYAEQLAKENDEPQCAGCYTIHPDGTWTR